MVVGAMEVKALGFVFPEEMFLLVCRYFTINSILTQMDVELHMTQGYYSCDEKLHKTEVYDDKVNKNNCSKSYCKVP